MTIFEIDYIAIEARGLGAETYGPMCEHRQAFVRAETIEDAVAALREWFPTAYPGSFDFGEVWDVKRHRTGTFIDGAAS